MNDSKMMFRLPPARQVNAIYGLIVLLLYGWSGYWYAWKLPSWITILPADQVFAASADLFFVVFLESFIVLGVVLGSAVVLPAGWLRNDFLYRGAILVLVGLVSLMLVSASSMRTGQALLSIGLGALGGWLLIRLAGRFAALRSLVESFAVRTIVFLYIAVPLSLVATATVLIRNVLLPSSFR